MPIFVRGELLQRSLASSTKGDDDEGLMFDDGHTALMRAALPSYDEESQIVDSNPKKALDEIQRTMYDTTRSTNTLADDLSSVGSMSHHSQLRRPVRRGGGPHVSVVEPIAEYDSRKDVSADFLQSSPRNISIDVNGLPYPNTSTGSPGVVSPYKLNLESWELRMKRKNNIQTRTARPNLYIATGMGEESRQDLAMGHHREPPSPPVRESLQETTVEEKSESGEDEPSRTLGDLISLLKKGYRVKLHTFRGREKAFLFLRKDAKVLCLREEATKRDEGGFLYLDTPIDEIENLEFGRRTDSGFLLSPLTSFSLGIKDNAIDGGVRYFDLEAASPVQREVLVSTLMIMMDAYGNGRQDPKNELLEQIDTDEGPGNAIEQESGTFDQPIVCSPSLEAIIPCSPSLEMEANGFGSQYEQEAGTFQQSTGTIQEVIHINEIDSFADEEGGNLTYPPKGANEFFAQEQKRSFLEHFSDFIDRVSSGEMTDRTSNKTLPIPGGVDIVSLAGSLLQSFSNDQGASTDMDTRSREGAEKWKSFSSDAEADDKSNSIVASFPHTDELKETSYVFKEEESVFSGTASMPINLDDGSDIISTLRSKAHDLSFSFSDHSFDVESTESVRGMLHSVRSRRMGRPLLTTPSYPTRISEMEELHEMSFADETASFTKPQQDNYDNESYQPQESQDRLLNDEEESTTDWSSSRPSTVETTAIIEINPRLEVPTPHNIHMTGSSHLIGGWCSDDVCTGTLNDVAKTCSGIFAVQKTQQAMSQAACIDPALTEEQVAMLEEYITSALGAPTVVYSYFTDGEELSKQNPSTTETDTPRPAVHEDHHVAQKFRNRAARSNAQANRIRNLKNEMTFVHALKHSKEMSTIRTTQSFDDAKLLPKLADKAAKKLHSSPLLDSLVSNVMNHWTADANASSQQGIAQAEEESVYYDSDPEDSRPRTMHQGPRKIRPVNGNSDKEAASRPKTLDGFGGIDRTDAKLGKKTDEDTIKEIVQSMMNERLLAMWHPTQSKDHPNRAPILARLWIESGVYLIDGSFLLPKLCWVKAFGHTHEGALGNKKDLSKVDLLDICRIRNCDKVDRSLHPFANSRLAWYIETQQDVFLFESETTEERNRIVYGLKLVVARLASLLMLRDIRAADEFFGAVSNGVPGEAPVWTSGSNKEEGKFDDASAATPSSAQKRY